MAASPGSKRGRDPEEEVYLDNLRSHKRYLSEIMASSLNGLTVEDPLTENLMQSPSRSETNCYPREECIPYSPMSEDSDDSRFCETPLNSSMIQSDPFSSPTSPVSPHRHQKQFTGYSSFNPYPLPGCTLPSVVCSHPRHRGSDSEGRFPSSPNDMCHSADLRRAALLRSVQMRAHPHYSQPYELPFTSGHENMQSEEEGEDQPFSCIKNSDDDTTVYQSPDHIPDYVEDCSAAVDGVSEAKPGHETKTMM
ncbi:hypothetical protein J5N97_014088 [Dioscorea zingiberensis]|uniref:Uncharacterized protein n=1 Tax=Dioscorea zingiberensis TaxID=325984 RepID=A0A9D5CTG1_9LILI|nr:hypothetical protein J5N97_014088 [Dioscorea zingiberensis]